MKASPKLDGEEVLDNVDDMSLRTASLTAFRTNLG